MRVAHRGWCGKRRSPIRRASTSYALQASCVGGISIGKSDMKNRRSLLLTAVACSMLAYTQPLKLDQKRIDGALTGMVDDGRAAGVSLLVWKDGREVFFGSAGFAD